MKFLCVQCESQMKIVETRPPDPDGSMAVLFGCPECFNQICLLTNPWETQMVASLGVKIGKSASEEDRLSKCPFSGVVREMGEKLGAIDSGQPIWTEAAFARLQNIPEFVRPMARRGIEEFARSQGYREIDERVMDQVRDQFGM